MGSCEASVRDGSRGQPLAATALSITIPLPLFDRADAWLFLKEKVSLVCRSGMAWSFPELPYYRRSADFLTG
jgi:hypothetical protein